jgi:predicted nucleic acid-binding Zn ribbon protein
MKKCKYCNKPFEPDKDNPQQEYCSEKCFDKAFSIEKKVFRKYKR